MGLATSNELPRRLALRQKEAAAALGVSVDYFSEHIAPEVRQVRRGRLWLYPVRELEQWVERNAVDGAA